MSACKDWMDKEVGHYTQEQLASYEIVWSAAIKSLEAHPQADNSASAPLICECGDHIDEREPHAHRDNKHYCKNCLN